MAETNGLSGVITNLQQQNTASQKINIASSDTNRSSDNSGVIDMLSRIYDVLMQQLQLDRAQDSRSQMAAETQPQDFQKDPMEVTSSVSESVANEVSAAKEEASSIFGAILDGLKGIATMAAGAVAKHGVAVTAGAAGGAAIGYGLNKYGSKSDKFKGYSPEVNSAIKNAAKETGVDENYLRSMAYIESKGNKNAVSSTGAKGLFQFTRGTARTYGIRGQEFDPNANALAAAKFSRDNAEGLRKSGIEPTPEMLYIAHQQGLGGAKSLYKAAEQDLSWNQLPSGLKKNMALNSSKGLSAKEYMNKWKGEYGKAAAIAGDSKLAQNDTKDSAVKVTSSDNSNQVANSKRFDLSGIKNAKNLEDRFDKMNPEFAGRIAGLSKDYEKATGKKVSNIAPSDMYRTYEEQVSAKKRHGVNASTPGNSQHGLGLAVDFGTKETQWAKNTIDPETGKTYAEKWGIDTVVPDKKRGGVEQWHITPAELTLKDLNKIQTQYKGQSGKVTGEEVAVGAGVKLKGIALPERETQLATAEKVVPEGGKYREEESEAEETNEPKLQEESSTTTETTDNLKDPDKVYEPQFDRMINALEAISENTSESSNQTAVKEDSKQQEEQLSAEKEQRSDQSSFMPTNNALENLGVSGIGDSYNGMANNPLGMLGGVLGQVNNAMYTGQGIQNSMGMGGMYGMGSAVSGIGSILGGQMGNAASGIGRAMYDIGGIQAATQGGYGGTFGGGMGGTQGVLSGIQGILGATGNMGQGYPSYNQSMSGIMNGGFGGGMYGNGSYGVQNAMGGVQGLTSLAGSVGSSMSNLFNPEPTLTDPISELAAGEDSAALGQSLMPLQAQNNDLKMPPPNPAGQSSGGSGGGSPAVSRGGSQSSGPPEGGGKLGNQRAGSSSGAMGVKIGIRNEESVLQQCQYSVVRIV